MTRTTQSSAPQVRLLADCRGLAGVQQSDGLREAGKAGWASAPPHLACHLLQMPAYLPLIIPHNVLLSLPSSPAHRSCLAAVGPEYYVSIMSFVDKTQLEPGSTVLLHNKVRGL